MPKYGYLFTLCVVYKTSWIWYLGVFHQFCKVLSQYLFKYCTKYPIIPLLSYWYSNYMYFKPFPLFLFPSLLMYIFYLCFFPYISFWVFSFGLSSNLLNNNLQVSGKSLTPSTPYSKHQSSSSLSAIWTKGLLLLLLIWVYIYHHWNPGFSVHPYSIKSKPILWPGRQLPTFSFILYIWLISLSHSIK